MLVTGGFMGIEWLREHHWGEEFDYNLLMSALKGYKAPHRKITALLQSGAIIRVKKGLYVFGDAYRQGMIHRGILANLMVGPSYVSQEYALSLHGMIPERVETVTSMTTTRNRIFHTSVGTFTYHYLNIKRFTVGVDWHSVDDKRHFLLASPEKALADTVLNCKNIPNKKAMKAYLLEDLRIDEEVLSQLDKSRLEKISTRFANPMVTLLCKTIKENNHG